MQDAVKAQASQMLILHALLRHFFHAAHRALRRAGAAAEIVLCGLRLRRHPARSEASAAARGPGGNEAAGRSSASYYLPRRRLGQGASEA